MDESSAKALTKRFFREAVPIIDKHLHRSFDFSPRKRKNAYLALKKNILKEADLLTHYSVFGPVKREQFGLTLLATSDYNLLKQWEERLLFGQQMVFSRSRTGFGNFSQSHRWEMSHHAVQRIFQRNTDLDIRDFDFSNLIQLVNNELRYVPVCTVILDMLLGFVGVWKNVYQTLDLSVTLPAKNGILLCNFLLDKEDELAPSAPMLSIRSFVSDPQMEPPQTKLKAELSQRLEPYVHSHFPYYLTNTLNPPDESDEFVLLRLLDIILAEFSSDFSKIFNLQGKVDTKAIDDEVAEYTKESVNDIEGVRGLISVYGWSKAFRMLERELKTALRRKRPEGSS